MRRIVHSCAKTQWQAGEVSRHLHRHEIVRVHLLAGLGWPGCLAWLEPLAGAHPAHHGTPARDAPSAGQWSMLNGGAKMTVQALAPRSFWSGAGQPQNSGAGSKCMHPHTALVSVCGVPHPQQGRSALQQAGRQAGRQAGSTHMTSSKSISGAPLPTPGSSPNLVRLNPGGSAHALMFCGVGPPAPNSAPTSPPPQLQVMQGAKGQSGLGPAAEVLHGQQNAARTSGSACCLLSAPAGQRHGTTAAVSAPIKELARKLCTLSDEIRRCLLTHTHVERVMGE
jgi:hypothetical protein